MDTELKQDSQQVSTPPSYTSKYGDMNLGFSMRDGDGKLVDFSPKNMVSSTGPKPVATPTQESRPSVTDVTTAEDENREKRQAIKQGKTRSQIIARLQEARAGISSQDQEALDLFDRHKAQILADVESGQFTDEQLRDIYFDKDKISPANKLHARRAQFYETHRFDAIEGKYIKRENSDEKGQTQTTASSTGPKPVATPTQEPATTTQVDTQQEHDIQEYAKNERAREVEARLARIEPALVGVPPDIAKEIKDAIRAKKITDEHFITPKGKQTTGEATIAHWQKLKPNLDALSVVDRGDDPTSSRDDLRGQALEGQSMEEYLARQKAKEQATAQERPATPAYPQSPSNVPEKGTSEPSEEDYPHNAVAKAIKENSSVGEKPTQEQNKRRNELATRFLQLHEKGKTTILDMDDKGVDFFKTAPLDEIENKLDSYERFLKRQMLKMKRDRERRYQLQEDPKKGFELAEDEAIPEHYQLTENDEEAQTQTTASNTGPEVAIEQEEAPPQNKDPKTEKKSEPDKTPNTDDKYQLQEDPKKGFELAEDDESSEHYQLTEDDESSEHYHLEEVHRQKKTPWQYRVWKWLINKRPKLQ